jgi:hypothetical protein
MYSLMVCGCAIATYYFFWYKNDTTGKESNRNISRRNYEIINYFCNFPFLYYQTSPIHLLSVQKVTVAPGDTQSHSVGLLWTSYRPVVETSA